MNTPTTTLAKIRAARPCGLAIGSTSGYQLLAKTLGKDYGDDAPITVAQIVESNGIDDAIWCLRTMPEHNNLWRHFAVDCAERVSHLLTDERSKYALTVARQRAMGLATDERLAVARAAAGDAAWAAAGAAARAAARDAAGDAAWAAAGDAAWAAGDAAREWQRARLLALIEAGEWARVNEGVL